MFTLTFARSPFVNIGFEHKCFVPSASRRIVNCISFLSMINCLGKMWAGNCTVFSQLHIPLLQLFCSDRFGHHLSLVVSGLLYTMLSMIGKSSNPSYRLSSHGSLAGGLKKLDRLIVGPVSSSLSDETALL